MNDPDVLYREIRAFVSGRIGRDPDRGDDTDLVSAGVMDSLALVSILADVEKKFGVFPDLMRHEPADLTSLNGLSGVIFRELTGADAPSPGGGEENRGVPGVRSPFDVIRLASDDPLLEDLPDLFLRMYRHFEEKSGGRILPLPEGGERDWLEMVKATPSKMGYLGGAVADSRLVGFIFARIKALPPYLGGHWVGEIAHLFVTPEQRRTGVGAALAESALMWLGESGVNNIELQVVSGNATADSFWRSMGFIEELTQYRRHY